MSSPCRLETTDYVKVFILMQCSHIQYLNYSSQERRKLQHHIHNKASFTYLFTVCQIYTIVTAGYKIYFMIQSEISCNANELQELLLVFAAEVF